MAAATDTIRYPVMGMDCASCAAKIEGAVRKVEGVGDVKVSIASQIMTLNVDDPQARLPAVEQAVTSLGYQLDRIGQPKVAGADAAVADLAVSCTAPAGGDGAVSICGITAVVPAKTAAALPVPCWVARKSCAISPAV